MNARSICCRLASVMRCSLHRVLGFALEFFQQLFGVVIDVTEYVGDAVALKFPGIIERAVFLYLHADHVGVAEQVVQVTQGFLIGTDQKNAQKVIVSRS